MSSIQLLFFYRTLTHRALSLQFNGVRNIHFIHDYDAKCYLAYVEFSYLLFYMIKKLVIQRKVKK